LGDPVALKIRTSTGDPLSETFKEKYYKEKSFIPRFRVLNQ